MAIDTPPEWRAMAWAARDAACDAMNAERRAAFEMRKAAIGESDLPKSKVYPAIRQMRLKTAQNASAAKSRSKVARSIP